MPVVTLSQVLTEVLAFCPCVSHCCGMRKLYCTFRSLEVVDCVTQVGFVAKGVVYALIGGLSCQSAIQGTVTIRGADNSPQVHGHSQSCFLQLVCIPV